MIALMKRHGALARIAALLLATAALAFPTLAQEAGGELFSISVDGEHVAGTPAGSNDTRKTDVALEAADIQVKFDGLGVRPILNAAMADGRRSYLAGEAVTFLASNNYTAYITRQEIRIFAMGRHSPDEPLSVIPVDASGHAEWTMPAAEAGDGSGLSYGSPLASGSLEQSNSFTYVLRVYDKQGRFDETRPLTFARHTSRLAAPDETGPAAPGFSDDNTSFRNIPVEGGVITVYGKNIPEGTRVAVLGDDVPVDGEGAFVVQHILPPGDHEVDVALEGGKGGGVTFNRAVNIPSSEWFYVGLADITLGNRIGSDDIEVVKPGDFDGVYSKGRAAFYLKGKIKGRYLLTAAADTAESDIENVFTGLDEKDPRSLLKRIDPEDYYPIYGDDSVSIEDAPTQGKFYIRLERGDNRVLWGNFKTEIRGTEFLRNDRGLYGGNLVLKSERMVASGERAGELNAYAAQPGTLPQRDVLRGTGGSAYFLSYRDLTVGSETLYVEVRNPITGRVVDRRQLRYGHDYTIDYLQGVVLLDRPLASTVSAGTVVTDGALGGNEQYLVAAYEYTPAMGDVDGYVYGGRGQQWIGDHVRLGVTGSVENTGSADQNLAGADIQIYKSERTFIEGEVAVSEGPGFGLSQSVDGGLTVVDTETAGKDGERAMAYRVTSSLDIADVAPGTEGTVQFYFAYKEDGFSTLDEQVTDDRLELGTKGDVKLSGRLSFNFYTDSLMTEADEVEQQAGAGLTFHLTETTSVAVGAEHLTLEDEDDNGKRTDAGMRLSHALSDGTSVYVFGQTTLDRIGDISRNDRGGVGGTHALTDTIDATGEVSYGTGGFGGRALLSYEPAAVDRYYVGYTLDPDRSASDDLLSSLDENQVGGIVAGVKRGFSERLSVYAENQYDFLSVDQSLTQVYGVTYTPVPEWKLGGAIESGIIWGNSYQEDDGSDGSDIDRTAVSLTTSYSPHERLNATLKGEVRFDNSEDSRDDLTAYYLAARFSNAVNDDWRFIASADAVLSDATESTRDGDYIEASLGYAYRPVANDRLNALARYTYLYDLPGEDQVTVDGTTEGPLQRSHIVNVDASYGLTRLLTVGGKYGLRFGESKPREGGDWESATAQLAVLRADIHVVKNWDVLIEGRSLWENTGETANFGLLAAVYRHLGENFEVGVGYNFGQFSDDLRDMTADDYGFFVNAVGKF